MANILKTHSLTATMSVDKARRMAQLLIDAANKTNESFPMVYVFIDPDFVIAGGPRSVGLESITLEDGL